MTKRYVIIFFVLMVYSQSSLAQSALDRKITLTANQVPLNSILDSLTSQSNLPFAYNIKRIPLQKSFSLHVENTTLENTLIQLFTNTNIEFSLTGQQVILYRNQVPIHTISGYIRDQKSGENLQEAYFYEIQQFRGVSSNQYGFYSLSLPEGKYIIRSSYIGYQHFEDTIQLYQDIEKDILLELGNDLVEVLVVDTANTFLDTRAILQQSNDLGEQINVEKAQNLPSIMGEKDVLKYVQLLPGVATSGLAGNSLNVRGGNVDQNLILLDDVPLYNINHLYGIVSTLNGDIIHSAKTYLEGFPARYGGRISSLIDLRTKDGDQQAYHGSASLGWLLGTAYLEGPIKKDKSAFVISGRHTWLNELLASLNPENTDIGFKDLNAKVNWEVSKKDRLYLSFYAGADKYKDLDIEVLETLGIENNWGNTALAFRWNKILGKRLFVNTTFLQSNFRFDVNFKWKEKVDLDPEADILYQSNIKQRGVKTDFSFLPNPKHHIRFGANYRFYQTNPGQLTRTLNFQNTSNIFELFSDRINGNEYNLYVEDEVKINTKLTLQPGFRVNAFRVQGKTWWSPELRFQLRYQPNKTQHWALSYAKMTQFIHLIGSSSIEIGESKWTMTTKKLGPSYARQVAASFQSFFAEQWKFKIGTYYKKMDGLRRFRLGANAFTDVDDWEGQTVVGIGNAYGVELLVAKTIGSTQGWLAYTLAKSNRRFDSSNNGRVFPSQLDRRHSLSLTTTHQFKEKIRKQSRKQRQLSMIWTIASGNWITLPTQAYTTQNGQIIASFDEVNNHRLDPFYRLDLSYNRKKITPKGVQHNWVFGLYNLIGKISPFGTDLYYNPVEQKLDLIGTGLLFEVPIPYITYGFKF